MEAKLLTADRFVDNNLGLSYRYVLSSTEFFRPHYHDFYELFLMLDGDALHIVNGKKIKLQKRRLVFIRPNDTHDYICANSKAFSMLNITFTQDTFNSLLSYLGTGFPYEKLLDSKYPPDILLSEHEFIRINRRMESICAIKPLNTEELKTAMRVLLFEIFTRCLSDWTDENENTPLWLETLCEEMEKNGNFIYGTERLLELSDKSREHIARCMKKYKNTTPSEFVNDIRLNYIANMLINSNHKVSDIIFESGFNNISWASELFKKRFGMTLRDFRTGSKNGNSQ